MDTDQNYDGQGKSREEDAIGAMRALLMVMTVWLAVLFGIGYIIVAIIA